MKQLLPFFLLCAVAFNAKGQEVIGSTGNTYSTSSVTVSQTVGEAVTGTVSNGVTVDQGFHQNQIIITSVPDQDLKMAINVFPNPSADRVMIQGTAVAGIEIFDMNGKLVQSNAPIGDRSNVEIDISGLSAGQYMLKVIGKESDRTNMYQLIKQ